MKRQLLIMLAAGALTIAGMRPPDARARGTVAAIPVPSPVAVTPTPLPVRELSLGMAQVDAYYPTDLISDPSRRAAYVHSSRDANGGPAISVIDPAAGRVTRLVQLPNHGSRSHDARLTLLTPGGKLLASEVESHRSSVVDTAAGQVIGELEDAGVAAADLASGLVALAGESGLRGYRVTDLLAGAAPLWRLDAGRVTAMAVQAASTPGATPRLLALLAGDPEQLLLLDLKTGKELAREMAPGRVAAIAAGPDGDWAVRIQGDLSQLVVLDAALRPVRSVDAPEGRGLFYDPAGSRYLLSGHRSSATSPMAAPVLMTYDDESLRAMTLPETRAESADLFARGSGDQVLTAVRFGEARVDRRQGGSMRPEGTIILGVSLRDMALDATAGVLYAADNQARIQVISLTDGKVRALWPGTGPLAWDPAGGRLYANRDGKVVALDGNSGAQMAVFPQGGAPAVDARRGRVYIADGGIAIYDLSGKPVGRLPATFPDLRGFSPNPYAYGVVVNPVTGFVLALMNNGVPGSNNSGYVEVYVPGSDSAHHLPGSFQYVEGVAFDTVSGRTFISYGAGFKSLDAVQVLDPSGREERILRGRSGRPAIDPSAGKLYLATDGRLTQLDASDLTLQRVGGVPGGAAQLLYGEGIGLIRRDEVGPRLVVMDPARLPPVAQGRRAGGTLPDEPPSELISAIDRDGSWVYVATGGEWYRSRDAKRWEQVQTGSLPYVNGLTPAGPGALFVAGSGPEGGDGVLRSTDDGATWNHLNRGLVDLRAAQPVVADSARRAFYVGRTGGVMAWREKESRWEQVLPSPDPYGLPGELAMAPDGSLFLWRWEGLLRSTDGGETWVTRKPPGEGARLLGFDGSSASPRTLYVRFDDGSARIARSRDGGDSWQLIATPPGLPPYASPIDFFVAGDLLYLYTTTFEGGGALWRSRDGGKSWDAAPPQSTGGTFQMAAAPAGKLWLAERGGVRSVDPARVPWQRLGVRASASPVATGTAAAPVKQPIARCDRPLPEQEAALASLHPGLGCPLAGLRTSNMARQRFERAEMFWVESDKAIYVLHADGTWKRFPDRFVEGMAESDPNLAAPPGLRQPVRGFGSVWRSDLGGPASSSGWGVEAEYGVSGAIQEWEGATLLRAGGQQFLLFKSGSWSS
jgi:photosystem II stability/assembly factor-like uncharacterized protein